MLHTKALYNLLRLNCAEAEPWAIEDLREVSTEEIWSRLQELGIALDHEKFLRYGEECDTPEELSELFFGEREDPKVQDRGYLLLFELWRRFLPEKQSISIFCEELDFRIDLYDKGKIESDEPIQDALANLQEILDEHADGGVDPIAIFEGISEYCAHDLEGFLYDVIAEVLDAGNSLYASELIEGFSPYVKEPIWFEFLCARLLSLNNMGEANRLLGEILKKEMDLELLLEVLHFLAGNGDRSLFAQVVKKINPLLKTQGEFQEVLAIASEYYRRLDQDALERAVQKLMERERSSSDPLHPKDPDVIAFYKMATG